MEKYTKGFTLIELLVVIAIIGILSSVVLASLNTARNKAKDASAKSSLSSVRADMEIYYNGDGNNTYGTAGAVTVVASGTVTGIQPGCLATDTVKLLKAASAQAATTSYCTVGVNGASYEADVTLLDGTIFCVDSSGFGGKASGATRTTTGIVACTQ